MVSQNRSIAFVDKPMAELLQMAKDQDRMIFLDAFTSWCGPCKWMAANMFTNDTIADYYNKTFICAHSDMEKGEGPELARAFQVRAYPTLLFINKAGEMVHMRVGAPQKVRDYLDMGRVALTPGEGFAACARKYKEGERDPKFIMKYLDRLQGAYQPVTEPLNQYFAAQKEIDLLNRDNWMMIYQFQNDIDSKEFNYLASHQKEFAKLYTRDSVNSKISGVCSQAIYMLGRSRNFNETTFGVLKEKIMNLKFDDAGKTIFEGELNIYLMKGEADKYLLLAYTDLDKFYSRDDARLNTAAKSFIQMATDPKYLEKAAQWARKSIDIRSTPENNDLYANLKFKLGNKPEAVKYEKQALELALKLKVPTESYEASLKKFGE